MHRTAALVSLYTPSAFQFISWTNKLRRAESIGMVFGTNSTEGDVAELPSGSWPFGFELLRAGGANKIHRKKYFK